MKKKIFFLFSVFLIYSISEAFAETNLQKNIIIKLTGTKTLSFQFNQKIADKKSEGNCYIKYPLRMKCNYQDIKKKVIIANGKTVAIVKKKYKKVYYYPIKSTPLFFILQKEKIINVIRKVKPNILDSKLIEFQFTDKNKNKIKIFFDKNLLEFRGWETTDIYSNEVSFKISNLKINNQIVDDFFKIPKEEEL